MWSAVAAAMAALVVLVWSTATGEPPRHEAAGVAAASPAPGEPEPRTAASGEGRLSPSGGLTAVQRPSGKAALVDNPLYATGRLAPLPCPVPVPDVDDPESMEGFLNVVADCLDKTWQTQFAKAGISFEPPSRVFWETPGTSPCRDYPSTAGAFYCRASKGIYIGTSDVVAKWNGADDSVVYASLLAHEYAHHVQGESGLLEYYHEQRRLEPDRARQNAWTRRSELQANCLAGAFLGAVSVTYPISAADREVILADAAATADREGSSAEERTHGSADNSVLWMEHGLEEQDPGACNTWEAAEETVQ
ncbi:neutral zinc metallopeptidase [Marinactinospora thermotolerans]|uniref:Metalloprotease n=1 Tax=Marinactinospora thermotolerans DSM 45154 TaxID=1122192 RepID=A0A1T4N0D1_9ACTN|nr:neutral zinc metallopeptidase [Marinactinospora thermotolerans]SJZ72574.1 hypothetical protein SAMN02745673_01214 [Marinactinospora thermotolerans DSM 45154]